MSGIIGLECTKCGAQVAPSVPQNVCPNDGGILFARYDLEQVKESFTLPALSGRPASLWRYREVLPQITPVTLGEGYTPLLHSREWENLWIKEEGLNPTGSFKARGISLAVSAAKAFGSKKLAMPSAGNAASALAAYAAAADLEAYVFMPRDVPRANLRECELYGAKITLVDGLINDCARLVSEGKKREGWFDVSTLKEPYRVEGKKTMAYELFEQLGGTLPDAIIFPSGGGVGVIAMWKAFDEMQKLGWIRSRRPRMIAVQAEGCAPLVQAWKQGRATVVPWTGASTIAAGLRVPQPYGDYLVLDILRRSQGQAIAVSEEEIKRSMHDWACREGILASPEGASSLAAYRKLLAQGSAPGTGSLAETDQVVAFNTGTGLKYLDILELPKPPARRQIGGLITPY
ncbi:MAG: threonine synthase [Acidobacteria bacterium]|nr:threonine synthase [Acidobacteriota bacterium]